MENTGIPLYVQLRNKILKKIKDGEFKRGERIPSEQELAEYFEVSRPTVRKAMSELVSKGYIIKKRGLGNFISKEIFNEDLNNFVGFVNSAQKSGSTATISTISKNIIECSEEIADVLNLRPGDKTLKLVLLRKVDGIPLNFKIAYYSWEKLNEFFEQLPNDTPYFNLLEEYLMTRFNVFPEVYHRSFEVKYGDFYEKEFIYDHLDVIDETPIILWKDTLMMNNKEPMEFAFNYYRADYYKFNLEQKIDHHKIFISNEEKILKNIFL